MCLHFFVPVVSVYNCLCPPVTFYLSLSTCLCSSATVHLPCLCPPVSVYLALSTVLPTCLLISVFFTCLSPSLCIHLYLFTCLFTMYKYIYLCSPVSVHLSHSTCLCSPVSAHLSLLTCLCPSVSVKTIFPGSKCAPFIT